ncbi:acyl-CoA dehydrogenase [Limnohabitans sp. JirII-31]|uniref:acyl-CoA dehydrogenase n=1 Tax=Limnohabitans sp. JirII-31 TaxID=1977908 RepID=UPI000C1F0F75|nr:acyl-CoA dehydrogenase [Limnohabitans sp. JirII-31]PIT80945.1 acyl-CoA dehydrogenase [Limnohabitans sp. JirII-31]
MALRDTVDFLLYDWLQAEALNQRSRFADHSRETFDAVLDTCERIARDKFAPYNRTIDTQEPQFDGERVILPQATHDAHAAYAASGMLSAAQDYDIGGMQLPYVVESAANAFFACASVSIGGGMLTVGNANLLMAYGSETQKQVFAHHEFSGRWSGTMCLSEPQAGSSLSDITTRAIPDGEDFASDPLGSRYRLKGHKMWISTGDHELTENIVHLVLAKIPGPDGMPIPGVKGISLFVVPKHRVDAQGKLTGQRNDVALAGLNHKCGWRGTVNTLLNFGEGKYPDAQGQAGAIGYLVGQPGEGLRCMFHMMNEARIGVGMAATMLGLAGYYASLDYAKARPQGRAMTAAGKDPASAQIRIIEHADVKRMLLAQKAYGEGALALAMYCARLVDEQRTGEATAANEARLLLEVLTPIAKSWPSEWCLEANSLAIQVHGGYGYTRDYPVEQYWRDNRLNMIHEGTHGIQGMDLLGRKVRMEDGQGMTLLTQRIHATVAQALQQTDQAGHIADHAHALTDALQHVQRATDMAWQEGTPTQALANAVPYLQAFGHMVLSWMWLEVERVSQGAGSENLGRRTAAQFFFRYELPKISAWLQVVAQRDMTCANMPEDAF